MSSKGQNVKNVVDEVKNSDVSGSLDVSKEVLDDGELQSSTTIIPFSDDGDINQDLWKALESDWPQQTQAKQQIVTVPRSTLAATKEEDFAKYYLPKVVSIGPYHYGEDHLKQIQDLKLRFARDLFSGEGKTKLYELYRDLHQDPGLRKRLRGDYDANSMADQEFSDNAFANMMFLDGCFILYYIRLSCGHHFETKGMLLNHQMISIRQDLFLLENQIPFKVLQMVKNHLSLKEDCGKDIQRFIDESTFSSPAAKKPDVDREKCEVHHLLHLLRLSLTKDCKVDAAKSSADAKKDAAKSSDNMSHEHHIQQHALPKVKELIDAGIRFQKNNTTLLCQIGFSKHWYHMLSTATVKLPPIIVEEASTKYLFLNLMAYEASSHKPNDMWVTSYICLLNSLISKSEDVKALRDAGVFADSEGSDNDIKQVIKDIAAAGRSAPDNLAYLDAKINIRGFYDRFKGFNVPISEFNDKYFNSPWSFLALVGAILALFLTAVQTYFTVIKGECDDLCKFLKLNHHL